MSYEKEIKNVQNILKGKFATTEDKMYWENKLINLKQKQFTAKQNQEYFKSYERGVKAYKDTRGY